MLSSLFKSRRLRGFGGSCITCSRDSAYFQVIRHEISRAVSLVCLGVIVQYNQLIFTLFWACWCTRVNKPLAQLAALPVEGCDYVVCDGVIIDHCLFIQKDSLLFKSVEIAPGAYQTSREAIYIIPVAVIPFVLSNQFFPLFVYC